MNLLEKLKGPDANGRFEALRQMRSGSPDPFLKAEAVRICQTDKLSHVRLEAVRALKSFWPDPEVVRAFQSRLGDELYIAEEIIAFLGKIGDAKALDILERCFFASTNIWIKIKVVTHFYKAPQGQIHGFVLRAGIVAHKDERLRAAAVSLLARVDNATLQALFASKLADECPRVRANALEALAAKFPCVSTSQHLVHHLADTHHRVRAVAVRYLLGYGFRRAEDFLARMVGSRHAQTRASAAWVIREVNLTENHLEWARRLQADADESVCAMATSALERLSSLALLEPSGTLPIAGSA